MSDELRRNLCCTYAQPTQMILTIDKAIRAIANAPWAPVGIQLQLFWVSQLQGLNWPYWLSYEGALRPCGFRFKADVTIAKIQEAP